jgi:hypothetical protein
MARRSDAVLPDPTPDPRATLLRVLEPYAQNNGIVSVFFRVLASGEYPFEKIIAGFVKAFVEENDRLREFVGRQMEMAPLSIQIDDSLGLLKGERSKREALENGVRETLAWCDEVLRVTGTGPASEYRQGIYTMQDLLRRNLKRAGWTETLSESE